MSATTGSKKLEVPTMDFGKTGGLIPAVVQDSRSGIVLMVGFMNAEALARTAELGKVTFFSRSKNRLWTKGEESGNFLHAEELLADCDADTVLIKARPAGPICHTGQDTCFGEKNSGGLSFLRRLGEIISERKRDLDEGSYTAALFRKGVNAVAQKVGEEAVELIIEAKDQDDARFKDEAADLLFHFMVLLAQRNTDLDGVTAVLESRHEKPK
jgi:phosphoribosyl-ATP pyrophosphohydrolase/phosphoribosyl-AMP cyclohydrolase